MNRSTGLGNGMWWGGDFEDTCNWPPPIDPRTYWAVQNYLSQYHGCPGCMGGTCGCRGPWGRRSLVVMEANVNGQLGASQVPWFLQLRPRRVAVYRMRPTYGPRFLGAGPDVYSQLNANQQAAVQQALFAFITGNACTSVLPSGPSGAGISAATDLADPTKRQQAVSCFQAASNITNTGNLDGFTLTSLMDASCPASQIADAVTYGCQNICPDDSRPVNGQCVGYSGGVYIGNTPQPPTPGPPAPGPLPPGPPGPAPAPPGTATAGMSTGTIVAIGVAAVAGGALLAYALTRKKTPAAAPARRRAYARR